MAEPLSKLAEKCKSCPKSEKCDHKRMELCTLEDLPPQNLASAIVNRIPLNEDKNCHIEHWSTRWRIEKYGKHTCLEVKKLR